MENKQLQEIVKVLIEDVLYDLDDVYTRDGQKIKHSKEVAITKAREANDKILEAIKAGDDEKSYELMRDNNHYCHTANLYRELEGLRETQQLEIEKVKTRFLLTDQEELLSPKGFYPGDGVRIKSGVWVQTDRLPRSSNLRCFEIKGAA